MTWLPTEPLRSHECTESAWAEKLAKVEKERDRWKENAASLQPIIAAFIEREEILREALESIIARSHSWVIRIETATIEMPIHDAYCAIASKALAATAEKVTE